MSTPSKKSKSPPQQSSEKSAPPSSSAAAAADAAIDRDEKDEGQTAPGEVAAEQANDAATGVNEQVNVKFSLDRQNT